MREDEDGIPKEVKYECEPVAGSTTPKCLLSKENRKRCRKVEETKNDYSLGNSPSLNDNKSFKKLQSFSKYVQDVRTAAGPVAVCGMVFAVVCGFLFLGIIGYIAGCLLWTTIILTEFCFLTFAIISLFRSGIITEGSIPDSVSSVNAGRIGLATSDEYEIYYKIAAGVFVFLSILFLTIVIFLRKKIVDAIIVIKISVAAVTDNYKIVFWPVVSFVFIGAFPVLFICYWMPFDGIF